MPDIGSARCGAGAGTGHAALDGSPRLVEPRSSAHAGGDEMSREDRISVDPEVRSGRPCIKGTRITVYDVLDYLAGGTTESEITRDSPDPAHRAGRRTSAGSP